MDVFSDYGITLKNYKNTYEKDIIKIGKTKKDATYIDFVPSGFDIETTTQYQKDKNDKVISHYTNMYIWQFSFDDIVFFGRTWSEFSDLLNSIKNEFLKANMHFLFFIHNASFESAFMLKELEQLGHTIKVFARSTRHPLKIEIDDRFIILDSAILSGYSLVKLAKNFCKTQKLKGDLDYSIIRNSLTPISPEGINEKELAYCRNDVVILKEWSEIYRDRYLAIGFMPLTSTMIASRVVRDNIVKMGVNDKKYFLISKAYPDNQEQYDYIMSFYIGAYTHGMLRNLFCTHENVEAFDVASEYPYALMEFQYPLGKFHMISKIALNDPELLEQYKQKYCCLFEVEFENIRTKTGITILSKNKIVHSENAKWDNGRLYSDSGRVYCRLTEVDILTLSLHYEWDKITYKSGLFATKGYLPDYYRLAIAELYSKKCTLKGVKGMEVEYMRSKADLNGQYGALVTKLTENEIVWEEGKGWTTIPQQNDFDKLKRRKNTLPQWGIWCTAWSRYYILSAIAKLPNINDFLYSDTDSIKVISSKGVLNLFDSINKETRKNNEQWITDLNLRELYPEVDFAEMGTFTHEDTYKRFKTLGSKRYLVEEQDGTIIETVAGLPKGKFTEYCRENNLEPFKTFSERGLYIAADKTSKLCSYYEDNRKTFEVTDYLGNTEIVTTESYVSLIPTTFNLTITEELLLLYKHIMEIEGKKV